MEILAFEPNPVDVGKLLNHVKDCVCLYFIAIISHLLCTHQDLQRGVRNHVKDRVCFYFIAIISHLLCTHQDLQGEFGRIALKFERDHNPNIKDCDLEHTLIIVNYCD